MVPVYHQRHAHAEQKKSYHEQLTGEFGCSKKKKTSILWSTTTTHDVIFANKFVSIFIFKKENVDLMDQITDIRLIVKLQFIFDLTYVFFFVHFIFITSFFL